MSGGRRERKQAINRLLERHSAEEEEEVGKL
jgi:hypothetical protein